MKGPVPAEVRLRRLLAMLPWLAERGEATVVELAERFGGPPAQVVRDLTLASLCGVPPFSPDALIELDVDDDVVRARVPSYFRRPMQLTPQEAFGLVAAAQALLAVPGSDPAGALARALAKLESALGERLPVAVDLSAPAYLDELRAAAAEGRRVEIDYWSAWRGEVSTRQVDPLLVVAEDGRWYLVADCLRAGGERVFRVDRIDAVRATEERFAPRAVAKPSLDPSAWPEARTVVLSLPTSARWVIDAYPARSVEEEGDGRVRVELAVLSRLWLERLLLRAGPGARVLAPEDLGDVGPAAARRILSAYGPSGPAPARRSREGGC